MKTHGTLLGMALLATPLLVAQNSLATGLVLASGNGGSSAHASQGYLGVGLRDVTEEQMNGLHVPQARGAEIVVIDHDAPAAKAGLIEHDVILRANGENVEGVEQFKRMVRETPAGHVLALVISRDGKEMTIPVKVADRAEVEKQAWNQHIIPESEINMSGASGRSFGPPVPGSGFFPALGGGNSYYTGVIVDALGPQLASFFGVQSGLGLLVKSVDVNSPAANAGIKAGDVITKVGQTQMATRNDFYRAVRENKKKQVPVVLLRDKKEQTVTLNVGEGKNNKSFMDAPSLPEMVELENLPEVETSFDFADLQPELESSLTALQRQMPRVEIETENLRSQMDKAVRHAEEQMRAIEPELREQLECMQFVEPLI